MIAAVQKIYILKKMLERFYIKTIIHVQKFQDLL